MNQFSFAAVRILGEFFSPDMLRELNPDLRAVDSRMETTTKTLVARLETLNSSQISGRIPSQLSSLESRWIRAASDARSTKRTKKG
jgi:hypothetical protein